MHAWSRPPRRLSISASVGFLLLHPHSCFQSALASFPTSAGLPVVMSIFDSFDLAWEFVKELSARVVDRVKASAHTENPSWNTISGTL